MEEHSTNVTPKILLLILAVVILFGVFYIPSVNSTIKQVYEAEVNERIELARELLNETDTDYTVGAHDPKLRIVVYTDTDCRFCAKMEPRFDRLLEEYPEEVAITYRHLGLPIYPNSKYEHRALECVGRYAGAEAYREFQNNFLMPNEFRGADDFTEQATVFATSYLVGKYQDEVTACIADPATQEILDQKRAAGMILGARQTPTMFYVDKEGNYKLQSGSLPYDELLPALNNFLGAGNELGQR